MRLTLIAAIVCTTLPCTLFAKPQKKKPGIVVLPVAIKNDADAEIVAAMEQTIADLLTQTEQFNVLAGAKLRKALKKDPAVLAANCGNLKCIALLGLKAKAKEVIYGRAEPSEDGVAFQMLVIDVKKKGIARRSSFSVASARAVPTSLREHFEELMGIEAPTDPTALAALDMGENTSQDQTPKTNEADSSKKEETMPEEHTEQAVPMPAVEEIPAKAPEQTDPPVLKAILQDNQVSTSTTTSTGNKIWTGSAVALTGIGAALAGTGGYFGLQSKKKGDEIASDTDLPTTLEIENDANAKAKKANVLMFAGGGVAVAGIVMLVARFTGLIDFGSTTVQVSPAGQTSMSFAW